MCNDDDGGVVSEKSEGGGVVGIFSLVAGAAWIDRSIPFFQLRCGGVRV